MENIQLISQFDKLNIDVLYDKMDNPKAIVQIVHGMSEHKERYLDLIRILNDAGYACVIHDHRGHGKSVINSNDHGNFYTTNENSIVSDMHQVTRFIKDLYPAKPLYIFAHSMGTLVTRCFLKKYDDMADKVIFCGAPTKNALAGLGLSIAKIRNKFRNGPDKFLDNLTFSSFRKKFNSPTGWLSKNYENVDAYIRDRGCNFMFHTNGFVVLYSMMKSSFNKDYEMLNPNLPIFFIAGEDDPVIGSKDKFNDMVAFFKLLGYKNTSSKLYSGLRHELINEKENEIVYKDIIDFFNR